MLKLAALLALAAASVSAHAQALAVCARPPSPALLASASSANQILEQVVRKDALDLDGLRKSTQKDVAKHPNDPFLLAVLGNIQFRAGDLETSIATLNRSMQLFPCIAYVHFTAAKYYALIGNQSAAQQQLELAHVLAPNVNEIAAAWTQTHSRDDSAAQRNVSSTQLQRRAPPSATPNGLMPFGGIADRRLLAPVTREVVIPLEKSGPPEAVATRGFAPPPFITPDNMPTLTLTLNGQPVRLRLNLGSEALTLSSAAAQRSGVTMTGPGTATANLSISGLELPATPLAVVDTPESAFNKTTLFTDGTVGLYFFSRSLIKLDVWGGQLTLSPLPSQSPAVASDHGHQWTPLYVIPSTRQLLVSAIIDSHGQRLFLLDLSALTSAIAPDTANRAVDVHEFHGGDGHWSTNTIRIDIGDKTVEVPHPQVLVEPRFPELGMGIYGRIGRDAIRGVNLTFDYRDHLMRVN